MLYLSGGSVLYLPACCSLSTPRRYHVEGSSESLYERWFYCDDLGTQLGPVIRDFFASEQHRTGRPVPGDNPTPCWEPDSNRRIEWPFSLDGWLQRHR